MKEILKQSIRNIVMILLMVICTIVLMIVLRIEIPNANRDLAMVLCGGLFTQLSAGISYYFGQSKGASPTDKKV